MAAPDNVTIEKLDGKWVLNKDLSNSTEPLLVLQGISWVTRKAIGAVNITLDITSRQENGVLVLEVHPSAAKGKAQKVESRIMDWSEQDQDDNIFGHSKAQTRLVTGAQEDGKTVPAVDMQTKVNDPNVAKFLKGLTLDDGKPSEGFLAQDGTNWVQFYLRNEKNGWTAEQVWGFEMVNGQRRHTRRAVVANKKGEHHLARLVYEYQG